MDPYATIGAVSSSGTATVTLGGDDDDPRGLGYEGGPRQVTLMLTLTAASGDEDISFPLDVGEVMAEVTFAGDTFDDIFTEYVTVFTISPAQCEMLFPLVTYIQADDGTPLFNTGFAIVNPAYSKEPASGHAHVHFLQERHPAGGIRDYRGFSRDGIGRRRKSCSGQHLCG